MLRRLGENVPLDHLVRPYGRLEVVRTEQLHEPLGRLNEAGPPRGVCGKLERRSRAFAARTRPPPFLSGQTTAPNDVAPSAYNEDDPPGGLPASPLAPRPEATGFRWAIHSKGPTIQLEPAS